MKIIQNANLNRRVATRGVSKNMALKMFHTLFLCKSIQKQNLCIEKHPLMRQKGWPSRKSVKLFYQFIIKNQICLAKIYWAFYLFPLILWGALSYEGSYKITIVSLSICLSVSSAFFSGMAIYNLVFSDFWHDGR